MGDVSVAAAIAVTPSGCSTPSAHQHKAETFPLSSSAAQRRRLPAAVQKLRPDGETDHSQLFTSTLMKTDLS